MSHDSLTVSLRLILGSGVHNGTFQCRSFLIFVCFVDENSLLAGC